MNTIVVSNYNLSQLVNEINSLIGCGYMPVGEISTGMNSPYTQIMVHP